MMNVLYCRNVVLWASTAGLILSSASSSALRAHHGSDLASTPYDTQSRFCRFKYNRFFEEFGTNLAPLPLCATIPYSGAAASALCQAVRRELWCKDLKTAIEHLKSGTLRGERAVD